MHVFQVPITFRDREEGESKLTMKQNIEYLSQLLALYWMKVRGSFTCMVCVPAFADRFIDPICVCPPQHSVLIVLAIVLVLAIIYFYVLPLFM